MEWNRASKNTNLASEFSDPDVLVECVVEILNVIDEGLRVSAVPMESNGIHLEEIDKAVELMDQERDLHGNHRRS